MTTRPVPLRLATVAGAAVLAVGLAACGGGSGGSSAAGSSTPTSARTSTPSVKPTPSPRATTAPISGSVKSVLARVAAATGAAKSVQGTITATTSGGSVNGTYEYEYTDAGLLASFSLTQATKTVTGIITPKAIYLGGAGLSLPSGKTYLKVDVSDDNPLAKQYRSLSDSFSSAADLGATVAKWRAIDNLKAAGTETIDGFNTVKYVGSIDPAKPPAGSTKAAKAGYAALVKNGVTAIDTTIWIGSDGLPLQAETKTVGGTTASTTTITYRSWGTPVTVTVPDEATVADFSKALTGR